MFSLYLYVLSAGSPVGIEIRWMEFIPWIETDQMILLITLLYIRENTHAHFSTI